MDRVALSDAVYLYGESTPAANNVSFVTLFMDNGATSEHLANWIALRAAKLSRLRSLIVPPLGSIGDVYWSDSPDFDARENLHVHTVSTTAGLLTALEKTRSRPLDMRRPAWEGHIFRGFSDFPGTSGPTIAVALKFHHVLGDGLTMEPIQRALFNRDLPERETAQQTTRLQATFVEALRLPLRPIWIVADLVKLLKAQKAIADLVESSPVERPCPVSRNQFTQPPGSKISVGVVVTSASELRSAAKALGGVSMNDLVLGAIGGALSDSLGSPEYDINALIPVSTRTSTAIAAYNHVSLAHISLSTRQPVVDRARLIHRAITAQRRELCSPQQEAWTAAMPRLPAFFYEWFLKRSRRRAPVHRPIIGHTKISTLPPVDASGWELAGGRAIARIAIGQTTDPHGTNLFVTTLNDNHIVTVTADAQQVDLPNYLDRLRNGLREAIELAHEPAPESHHTSPS